MLKFNLKFTLFFIALFLICACKKNRNQKKLPNVKDVSLSDFQLIRFEKELDQLNLSDIPHSYQQLEEKHPYITELYFKRLLGFENDNQDTFYNRISSFLEAPEIKKIQDTINTIFNDFSEVESDLKQTCRYVKHYFPKLSLPNFYTYQTEFGYQVIIFKDDELNGKKDGIGIGLDMFLGNTFNYKMIDPKNPSFSRYLTRTYNKDHIVKKTIELLLTDIMGNPNGKRMIDQIIHNGKILYILDHVMPTTSDTVIMEYSQKEWQWVQDNEREIWSYFLDNKLLYETNHLKITKLYNYPISFSLQKNKYNLI